MTPDSSLHFDERKDKLEPLVQVLGGQLKKKALHTIEFSPEMRALAYIMIFNLYPVKNLTTLSGQGPSSYMISLLTMRLIFVVTSTISSSSA